MWITLMTFHYPIQKKPVAVSGASQPSNSEDDEENVEYVSFSISDLAYESIGNLVYETDNVTIVAKELPSRSYEYISMF